MNWTVPAEQESQSPGKTFQQKEDHLARRPARWSAVPNSVVFNRDILHQMPNNIRGAIYADDLALWYSEEHITTANYRLQRALQVIETWVR